jgi:hypothetical protein
MTDQSSEEPTRSLAPVGSQRDPSFNPLPACESTAGFDGYFAPNSPSSLHVDPGTESFHDSQSTPGSHTLPSAEGSSSFGAAFDFGNGWSLLPTSQP